MGFPGPSSTPVIGPAITGGRSREEDPIIMSTKERLPTGLTPTCAIGDGCIAEAIKNTG